MTVNPKLIAPVIIKVRFVESANFIKCPTTPQVVKRKPKTTLAEISPFQRKGNTDCKKGVLAFLVHFPVVPRELLERRFLLQLMTYAMTMAIKPLPLVRRKPAGVKQLASPDEKIPFPEALSRIQSWSTPGSAIDVPAGSQK